MANIKQGHASSLKSHIKAIFIAESQQHLQVDNKRIIPTINFGHFCQLFNI
jgi:hypothetical protein